jgi:hypothetical protein
MDKWLKIFRGQYRERLLDLSWRQWTTLGVPGHAQTIASSLTDPDALLIFSCFIARYDQRLFDEMLEWLGVNGSLLNIQRLKRMLPHSPETAHPILGAVAFWMRERGAKSKWASLSQPPQVSNQEQSLFFLTEGKPMPASNKPDPIFRERGLLRNEIRLRNRGKSFSPENPANLILKLRAFVGVNSRADLAAYLLTHEQANAYEMARACWFSQRAVHDALTEMRRSQLIHSAEKGREIAYFIQRDRWEAFLKVISPLPEWRNWHLIFSLLNRIHEKLTDERIMQASGEALNSELTLFARSLKKSTHDAGLSKIWVQHSPESASQGSVALEKMVTAILDEISQ